jgi:hypothetical protein
MVMQPEPDGRLHVLRRGQALRRCEARVSEDAYDLVITIEGATHVESFSGLTTMLARERALLRGWRAHGWRDVSCA